MAKPDLKVEAIRLRVEERLSYDEILARVAVARGSLSLWLRSYPLTEAEMGERRKRNAPTHSLSSRKCYHEQQWQKRKALIERDHAGLSY